MRSLRLTKCCKECLVRRRVVIGFIVIVGGAIAVAILSGPRRGTVQWHKREFSTAMDRLEGNRSIDRLSRLWGKITGRPVTWEIGAEEGQALILKLDEHRIALIEHGYLIEQKVGTTNNAITVSMRCAMNQERMIPKEHREFAWIADAAQTNWVTVIGRREDLPKWEEMIRKLDGP